MRAGRLAERPYDVPQRIVIPNLTGMIVPAALRSADDVGFTLASADPMMRLAEWHPPAAGRSPSRNRSGARPGSAATRSPSRSGGITGDPTPVIASPGIRCRRFESNPRHCRRLTRSTRM